MRPLTHGAAALLCLALASGCSPASETPGASLSPKTSASPKASISPSAEASDWTWSPGPLVVDPEVLKAATSTSHYTDSWVASETLGAVAQQYLYLHKFPQLKELVANVSNDRRPWFGPVRRFESIINGLSTDDLYWGKRVDHALDSWVKEQPKSKEAHLLRLAVKTRKALDLGSRPRLEEEKQKLTLDCIKVATAFEEAKDVPGLTDSSDYWASRLRFALLCNAPPEEMDRLLDEVLKRDPENWQIFGERAFRDHPGWLVTEDPSAYRERVDALGQKYGPMAYAACAWDAQRRTPEAFSRLGLDFDKIQAGFRELEKAAHSSNYLTSAEAWMALASGKKEQAKPLLERLGRFWARDFWDSPEAFRQSCQQAGAQPRSPGKPELIAAGAEEELLKASPEMARTKRHQEYLSRFSAGDYALLDQIASDLRKGKKREELSGFYNALFLGSGKAPLESALARCDEWEKALPDSATVGAVRANILIREAWYERGSGWGSTVTEEGWALYKSYLDQAAEALDKRALSDPQSCAFRIQVAMGRNEPVSVVDKAAAKSLELDKQSMVGVLAKMVYLLPRWHGSREAVTAYANEILRTLGPDSLARVLLDSHMGEAILDELPYPLVDNSLKALQKETSADNVDVLYLRAFVENHYGHAKAAAKARQLLLGNSRSWGWKVDSLDLPEAGPAKKAKMVEIVESGQYSYTLPKPTRLKSGEQLPLVAYRGLGLRVKFQRDLPDWTTMALVLQRTDKEGHLHPMGTKTFVYAPGEIKKGSVVLYDVPLEQGDDEPGVWKMGLYDQSGDLIVEKEFQMVASDLPPEPGVRLEMYGSFGAEKAPWITTQPHLKTTTKPPLKLGTAMGIVVSYVGQPTSGEVVWTVPKGQNKLQDGRMQLDPSKPWRQQMFRWIYETPAELIPGIWAVQMTLDGRDVGKVDFELH